MSRLALRGLRILACMVSLSVAAGCGDSCLSLAKQICSCQPDDGTRAACQQRAKDAEANFPVRAEDQKYCQQLLDSNACDCNKLGTVAGRQQCGITYGPPATP